MGIIIQAHAGVGNADLIKQFHGAGAGRRAVQRKVQLERLQKLLAYGEHRVERGEGVLEHHPDLSAAHAAYLLRRQLQQIAALESSLAGLDLAWRLRDEA